MKVSDLKKIFPKLQKKANEFVKTKLARRIALYGGLGILALAAAFFSVNLVYLDRILPHTYISQTNFGGLNRSEAEGVLNDLLAKNQDFTVNYSYSGNDYHITSKELEVDFQAKKEETLDRLFGVGRNGAPGKLFKDTLRAVFSKNKILVSFKLSNEKLSGYLDSIAKDTDVPEKDASIEFKDNSAQITEEKVGQKFDREKNSAKLLQAIGDLNVPDPMIFEISKILPKIDRQAAQKILPQAQQLANKTLTLTGGDKTFELKGTELTDLADFVAKKELTGGYTLSLEISSDKTAAYVQKIASEIDQEPQDAKFQVQNGKVSAFQVAKTGYKLNQEKTAQAIINVLKSNENQINLKIDKVDPEIAASDPQSAGITELIGEGKTSWRGSPPNRIHNLTLGANKISGTIVKPGQEFSTVKTIGEIDAAAGFLPELVIKNSTEVVPDYGGGLCQVSTTLFRSVLNSGLKITARTAHSFRVSYYEPPVGMDATIYDPAPDFKFINNMETPILIWAVPGNNSLDFQIYGTKDGRKVEISDPVVGDYVSPPGPVYSESASMAPGDVRQVERATSGATASFNYKVTDASGQVLQKETFVSKYVPLPDSFLVGPGTPVPSPAE